MKRSRAVCVPVLVLVLGLLASWPAAARVRPSAPSAMAGFADVGATGGVDSLSTYDSAGGTVSAANPITGTYDVRFGRLGFAGGDVQVTPIFVGAACAVASWAAASDGSLDVQVLCYDSPFGALSQQPFEVLVTQPHSRPGGVLDYSWVYKPNGRLTNRWSYNSSHKVNSVRHLATGEYQVTMPGPGRTGANAGTVKVTPYGIGGGSCQVFTWRTTRTGELVTVRCFKASGAPQDREFDIVYARGNNLMGQNGKTTANAYANGTATLYQPSVQFDSRRHARVTVVHLDRGLYEVILVGSNAGPFPGGFGNVQVSAVAGTLRYCTANPRPTRTPTVFVDCVKAAGNAVDTAFTVQWVVG